MFLFVLFFSAMEIGGPLTLDLMHRDSGLQFALYIPTHYITGYSLISMYSFCLAGTVWSLPIRSINKSSFGSTTLRAFVVVPKVSIHWKSHTLCMCVCVLKLMEIQWADIVSGSYSSQSTSYGDCEGSATWYVLHGRSLQFTHSTKDTFT